MKKLTLLLLFLFMSLNTQAQFIAFVSSNRTSPIEIPIYGKPVLSNFRITNAQPSRVYYDVVGDETGLTTTGFTISGKTIDSINTTSNYFTVSAPFTFWDNNTIRYEGVETVIYNFTLTYITNNINEPEATTNIFYVEAGATGGGSTIGNPMSIESAITSATAGSTIYMKAGNYGNKNLSFSAKDGEAASPIKLIGYKNTPLDITTNYFDYGVTLNTSEMPTLTGSSSNSGTAIYLHGTSFLIIKNIQITNYKFGIATSTASVISDHIIVQNSNFKTFGSTIEANGVAIAMINEGVNGSAISTYIGSTYCKFINNRFINSSMSAISSLGDGLNLFEGNKSYNDRILAVERQDYHFAFNGDNNIFRNGYVENFNNTSTNVSTHGIGVRGQERLVNNYNLIELSTSVNITEGLYVRNYGCNYNVIKDNIATNNGNVSGENQGGIYIWGGCDYNIFERNYISDVSMGIGWKNNTDNGLTYQEIGTGNIIRNNIFKNVKYFHSISNTIAATILGINYIYNNVFDGADYFARNTSSEVTGVNLIHKNNIIIGASQYTVAADGTDLSEITFDYNNFYLNGSWDATYIGVNNNIDVNPSFVNTVDYVPTVNMDVPKLTGVNYDINGTERPNSPDLVTIGAVEINTVTAPTLPANEKYLQDNAASIYTEVNAVGAAWQLYDFATLESDETEFYNGSYSLKQINTNSASSSGWNLLFDVISGNTYTVSFWYKQFTPVGSAYSPRLYASTNTSIAATVMLNSEIWVEEIITVTATGTGVGKLRFYTAAGVPTVSGTVLWLDNISILEN